MPYLPPSGEKLGFSLSGADYTPPGGAAVAFNMTFYPPYVPPAGEAVALDFSGAYDPPAGDVVGLEFVRGSGPAPTTQYVFPVPVSDGAFGDVLVRNQRAFVSPAGINQSGVGAPALKNSDSYVRPAGIAAAAYGRPSVRNYYQNVNPTGIPPGGYGAAKVENRDRYLYVQGFIQEGYGRPVVVNFRAYLRPGGFDASGFGTASLAGGVRGIETNGTNHFAAGRPFVAYGQREVRPAGIFQGGYGRPVLGYQRAVEPSGIEPLGFGQANVADNTIRIYQQGRSSLEMGDTVVDHLQRRVAPRSIASNLAWGLAEVINRRQIVMPYAETGDWGERFGTFNYVDNRNRQVTNYGWQSSRFGVADILNAARPVLTPGMDAVLWGASMVSHGVRYITPLGIDAGPVSAWTAVTNAARVIRPAGFDAAVLGQAQAVNTRRYLDRIGNWESLAMGTAFVADRIREVVQFRFPDPPQPGEPKVELSTNYLDVHDRGIPAGGIGFHDVISRKNIIAPRWNYTGGPGYPALRNVTPEIGGYGHDSAEFGRAAVRNSFETYRFQGFAAALYGRPAVEYRTKSVFINGIRAGAFGVARCLWGDPNLPYARTLETEGFSLEQKFGLPRVGSNVIRPGGIDGFRSGQGRVHANSIFPVGYAEYLFGVPSLNFTQTVSPSSIAAPPAPPAPVLSPLTVWAPSEGTNQAVQNHGNIRGHLMDARFFSAGMQFDDGNRPFFGRAKVTIPGDQTIIVQGLNAGRYGDNHWASLRVRTLLVDGLRSLRMGFPSLRNGGEALMSGFDMLAMGGPTVSIYVDPTRPRTVTGRGFAAGSIGATIVQNFHRQVLPAGFLATRHGAYIVGPPKRATNVTIGLLSAYGTPFVAYRNRFVRPEAIAEWQVSEYTPGLFDRRIRVAHTGEVTITPIGIDAQGWGYPAVANAQHVIKPLNCCSSGLRAGRPSVAHA